MKLVLMLSAMFAIHAFAAEVHLSGGENMRIQANTETTVYCGAGGSSNTPNCADPIAGLKTLVDACKSGYAASWCIDKYWPTFVRENPSCRMAGLSVCIDYCKTGYAASWCADHCMQ